MQLKLFKVTCWYDYVLKEKTFESFVIAGNEVEAKRIVEEEVWSYSGMEIKCVQEIDMSLPQLICFINTDDLEL